MTNYNASPAATQQENLISLLEETFHWIQRAVSSLEPISDRDACEGLALMVRLKEAHHARA
jgi:hypothetical protein